MRTLPTLTFGLLLSGQALAEETELTGPRNELETAIMLDSERIGANYHTVLSGKTSLNPGTQYLQHLTNYGKTLSVARRLIDRTTTLMLQNSRKICELYKDNSPVIAEAKLTLDDFSSRLEERRAELDIGDEPLFTELLIEKKWAAPYKRLSEKWQGKVPKLENYCRGEQK